MKQRLLLIIAGIVVAGCSTNYTITVLQVGSNVVATGRGAIDLTGLTLARNGGSGVDTGINPPLGLIEIGTPYVNTDEYGGFTGPMSFGNGGPRIEPNIASGDHVGMNAIGGGIVVPHGYVSGVWLSDTMTFNKATFASIGVTPGTYVWTWGTGANQNFTLIIRP